MSARAGLSAFGLGAVPCVALCFALLILGWTDIEPVPVADGPPTPHNLELRAKLLREHLPDAFQIEVVAPFVLVAEVSDTARYVRTIRELSDEVRAGLFERDPNHVVDVWLFADTASYRHGVRTWLADWPRTLNGFYSPKHHAVVVNLASGEATLRHELVHPYLSTSFPELPAWVDEGVASLFEQPAPEGGKLPRLQKLLLARRLPSVAALTAGTDRDFYADPRRMSYAQARYVMQFLRSRGLLQSFLSRLKSAGVADPTGFDTLLSVSQSSDAEAFQRAWESFVLRLDR